jgi:hypothetical protein
MYLSSSAIQLPKIQHTLYTIEKQREGHPASLNDEFALQIGQFSSESPLLEYREALHPQTKSFLENLDNSTNRSNLRSYRGSPTAETEHWSVEDVNRSIYDIDLEEEEKEEELNKSPKGDAGKLTEV